MTPRTKRPGHSHEHGGDDAHAGRRWVWRVVRFLGALLELKQTEVFEVEN